MLGLLWVRVPRVTSGSLLLIFTALIGGST